MPRRATGPTHGKKIGTSVTIDPGLYQWVMEHVGAGKQFSSLSHACERGFALLREHEEGKWVRPEKK